MNRDALIGEFIVREACDAVYAANGSAFIFRRPGGGALEFKHKIFHGLRSDLLAEVSRVLDFDAPNSYLELLREFDGLSLYYGRLKIYSFRQNLDRSIDIESQVSVSLIDENFKFNYRHRDLFDLGFRVIGSITSNCVVKILIDEPGKCYLFCGDDRISVGDVCEFLKNIISPSGKALVEAEDRADGDIGLNWAALRQLSCD